MNADILFSNHWSTIVCYQEKGTPCVHDLELQFWQKHSEGGVFMTTNQYGALQVVRTNGILKAAVMSNVQVAQTNAP
jgi:hypothetical protein